MHRRCRPVALAALVACAAVLSGCLAQAEPATSVPLESIAPRPPPITAGEAITIVGYELSAIHVGTRFVGEWNGTTDATLRDMGFEPQDGSALAFARDDATLATVAPAADGFWLNITYGFDHVFAPSLAEANERAHEEWLEVEPHFVGTLSHFTDRTGALPQGHSERSNAFHARIGGGAP